MKGGERDVGERSDELVVDGWSFWTQVEAWGRSGKMDREKGTAKEVRHGIQTTIHHVHLHG
jgi:hypothetical protein